MGQTTDKIETFIESKREELGSNLQELEQKVKSATDWRQHFQKNPMTMMGVAVGGGVLLAQLLPRRSSLSHSSRALRSNDSSDRNSHVFQAFDNVKGALIGVATTRFTNMLEDYIPGFREHLEGKKKSQPANSSPHI